MTAVRRPTAGAAGFPACAGKARGRVGARGAQAAGEWRVSGGRRLSRTRRSPAGGGPPRPPRARCDAGYARQASRPSVMRSRGRSTPMNTILLVFFSAGSHFAARSLPII